MKKDKKYLEELEKKLEFISKRDKRAIVLKYEKIIEERRANKEKITTILKSIGPVSEVAQKEIEEYRKARNAEYCINRFFSRFKKDEKNTPKEKVSFLQKLKEKREKKKEEKKKKEKEKVSFIQKLKEKREKRKEEKAKKEKKSFFDRFKKEKTLKEKIEDKIEEITE